MRAEKKNAKLENADIKMPCDPRAQVMCACSIIHLGPNIAEKRLSRTFAGSRSETIATIIIVKWRNF